MPFLVELEHFFANYSKINRFANLHCRSLLCRAVFFRAHLYPCYLFCKLGHKLERNGLLKENKVLKNHNTAFEYLSATNDKAGHITCLDCDSNHIAYESADSEFSFDVSTNTMRKQISVKSNYIYDYFEK